MITPREYPEVALYVTEKTDHGFYHVLAHVVTLNTERTGSIRNVNDYTTVKGGWFLDNLQVFSQGNAEDARKPDRTAHLYGFEVSYSHTNVDLQKVTKMAKTLVKLDKALTKLNEKRGYVQTYGEYVSRVAEILGCTKMVFSVGGVNTLNPVVNIYYNGKRIHTVVGLRYQTPVELVEKVKSLLVVEPVDPVVTSEPVVGVVPPLTKICPKTGSTLYRAQRPSDGQYVYVTIPED